MSWNDGAGGDWGGGGGDTAVASTWEKNNNNSVDTTYEAGAASFDNVNVNAYDSGYGDADGGAGGGDRACFNCGETG
ncbi:hypothetical protein VMCG_08176 [Cytospora schulzeri]|uniref:Uncharacterized protein n=1 Tax=Cytospora schulzeri TaxID=448051 RepID=A0A423VTY5_9PEZI|nr:hypothetical protein VMCG_08176 [Valsa malicola]